MSKAKIAAIVAGAVCLFGATGVALASSILSGMVSTSAATTTPAFMTPGTGTSTLTYNTLTNTNVATATPSSTNQSKAIKLSLAGQFSGSSTVATLNIKFEYSTDGIDWYQSFLPQGNFSTTTQAVTYGISNSVAIPFASTTYNGSAGKFNIENFIVDVPIVTKDVRAVVTITGANGAFWGQFVPVKEQP